MSTRTGLVTPRMVRVVNLVTLLGTILGSISYGAVFTPGARRFVHNFKFLMLVPPSWRKTPLARCPLAQLLDLMQQFFGLFGQFFSSRKHLGGVAGHAVFIVPRVVEVGVPRKTTHFVSVNIELSAVSMDMVAMMDVIPVMNVIAMMDMVTVMNVILMMDVVTVMNVILMMDVIAVMDVILMMHMITMNYERRLS